MVKRHGRRTAGAAAAVAALALLLAGCGGGGGGGKADPKASASAGITTAAAGATGGGSPSPSATPTQVLAQIKGGDNVVVTLNTAVRDKDGYVTVQGSLVNNGTKPFDAQAWRGQETSLVASGSSLAGAVLVDEAGKKRYYVLRDTDGRCLCTMGLMGIMPNETRPVFAQFPAPPAATTEVQFVLPGMPPAKITLSQG